MIEMESERGFSREKKKDGPIWCKAGGGNLGEKMEAIFFEERERQGYPHETKEGNPPEKKGGNPHKTKGGNPSETKEG